MSCNFPSIYHPRMKAPSLDHVAVAVESLEDTLPIIETLSRARAEEVADFPAHGVRVAFVGGVEVLQPTHPDSPVASFLAAHGPGLHHVALQVDDLELELDRLEREGFQRAEPEPRIGVHGRRLIFLHPRTTGGVIFELVERSTKAEG